MYGRLSVYIVYPPPQLFPPIVEGSLTALAQPLPGGGNVFLMSLMDISTQLISWQNVILYTNWEAVLGFSTEKFPLMSLGTHACTDMEARTPSMLAEILCVP